jgi:hypothetical protein
MPSNHQSIQFLLYKFSFFFLTIILIFIRAISCYSLQSFLSKPFRIYLKRISTIRARYFVLPAPLSFTMIIQIDPLFHTHPYRLPPSDGTGKNQNRLIASCFFLLSHIMQIGYIPLRYFKDSSVL